MAELSGENGAVYFNEELASESMIVNSIAYSTGGGVYTITSSTGDGASSTGVIDFQTAGYVEGMLITLSDSSYDASTGTNNRIYTITACTSGEITVTESLTAGTDTGTPTIREAEPGIQVLGFYNWTSSLAGDALETTDFDSSGYREYIAGLTGWTVTSDKYFQTANNEVDDWVGQTCEIRLFINYETIPSSGSPSQYWKGDTVVTGIDNTTPVDALVSQSINFQGDGALTLKTQTKAWNEGIST